MPSLQQVTLALALALMLVAGATRAEIEGAETEVDVELVLAADISSSMDMGERYLQRLGHSEALRHPDVLRAIQAGFFGRIAVTYFEWSDSYMQRVVLPWTVIEDRESAEAAARMIDAAPPLDGIRTSISGALDRAREMLGQNGYSGLRRVIDIAGDEPNNAGRPLADARAEVLAQGITINGLAIVLRTSPKGTSDTATLDRYFADALIGGPLAFVMTVRHRDDFVEAIRRKLVLEIAGLQMLFAQPSPQHHRAELEDASAGAMMRSVGQGGRSWRSAVREGAGGGGCTAVRDLRRPARIKGG